MLRELHYAQRRGERATPYRLEKRLGLQRKRVKSLIEDMRSRGLIGEDMDLTERGYAFLEEYTTRIRPFLERYGLSRDWDERSGP